MASLFVLRAKGAKLGQDPVIARLKRAGYQPEKGDQLPATGPFVLVANRGTSKEDRIAVRPIADAAQYGPLLLLTGTTKTSASQITLLHTAVCDMGKSALWYHDPIVDKVGPFNVRSATTIPVAGSDPETLLTISWRVDLMATLPAIATCTARLVYRSGETLGPVIETLEVAEAQRGKGFGPALLLHVEKYLKTRWLLVNTADNRVITFKTSTAGPSEEPIADYLPPREGAAVGSGMPMSFPAFMQWLGYSASGVKAIMGLTESALPPSPPLPPHCEWCGGDAPPATCVVCPTCKVAQYCSSYCQQKAVVFHKLLCAENES